MAAKRVAYNYPCRIWQLITTALDEDHAATAALRDEITLAVDELCSWAECLPLDWPADSVQVRLIDDAIRYLGDQDQFPGTGVEERASAIEALRAAAEMLRPLVNCLKVIDAALVPYPETRREVG